MSEQHDMALAATINARRVMDDVVAEIERARAKFGDQTGRTDPEWLSIVTEELGEAAQVINERMLGNRPLDNALRDELVQIAASAVRWIMVLDAWQEWNRSPRIGTAR